LRACGFEFSGFDLATNQAGTIENSQFYWIPFLAGLIGLAVGIALLRTTAGNARALGLIEIGAGLFGMLPLLNIWSNYSRIDPGYRGLVQFRPGAFLTFLGLLGLCGAGAWAMSRSAAKTAPTTSVGPGPGTPIALPTQRCLNCGAELPAGSRFCGKCGAQLQPPAPAIAPAISTTVTCPECKTDNPQRNKFCNRCGASLAGVVLSDERLSRL